MKPTRFQLLRVLALAALVAAPTAANAAPVDPRNPQPLLLHGRRLAEALDYTGFPLPPEAARELRTPPGAGQARAKAKRIQTILDPLCIAELHISPESRVSVKKGAAKAKLAERNWRAVLIKVHNEAGVTAPLNISSPQILPEGLSWNATEDERWMRLDIYRDRPLAPRLGGTEVEYRLVHIYARAPGQWSALLQFDVGQGTQDLGFRSDLLVNFDVVPVAPLQLGVLDEAGVPTAASFEFRNELNHVYPAQAPRLAPDFPFHPQVYRYHGQRIALPVGKWTVTCRRGPEYHPQIRTVLVQEGKVNRLDVRLERWIDPSRFGWWSGDHHIHAAGCKHYTNPTEGVHPPDMMLHCRGEDLKIGANLTWGPGFDYQKQFFTGREDDVSKYPYLLRYDVEVSGFGSHRSGHLCLLRLTEQIYPGGDSKHHWPTLCLNTLKWAQRQGGVAGPAHSGWGLAVKSNDLPNFEIPPFDGIGANEYIVDVTHMVEGPGANMVPAVDFMSLVDTPYVWELNIWYHTLNCGYRTRVSGETDFPCIYGERVGLGRSYIKVDGRLSYDKWCQGISRGRGYVSDGLSHLIDFSVNGTQLGSGQSEVKLEAPGLVAVKVKAAGLLQERPARLKDEPHGRLTRDKPDIATQPYVQKPYWHLERARIGDSREVEVEVVVNGFPAATRRITANGELLDIEFDVPIERSSWVAVRVLPSSHTNPVWVVVNDKPVRASKRSAEWCLESVEKCWQEKQKFIAQNEMKDAVDAYAHARKAYRKILAECETE